MEVLKTEETFCLTYHIGTSVTHYYAWSVHLNYLYDCAEEKKNRKERETEHYCLFNWFTRKKLYVDV
jgi:hypothetical protein